MKRARSDEAKQERRGEIMATAWAMYNRAPSFAAFTMSALAAEVGLAKGTLYLYFRTKEALFLALLDELFGAWFTALDARLDADSGAWTAARAADEVVASVRGRGGLVRLLAILPTIVEHNVEFDAALAFKRRVVTRAAETGRRLEARLPWMVDGQGARFLVDLHALVIGVWQLAEPSAVIRRVMERPEMEPARVDFERDLRRLCQALLTGMRAGDSG